MDIFINGTDCISPLHSYYDLENQISLDDKSILYAMEPDYKKVISPGLLRRMSKVMKMGVTTGLNSLSDAKIEKPQAIICGTGLGCLQEIGRAHV